MLETNSKFSFSDQKNRAKEKFSLIKLKLHLGRRYHRCNLLRTRNNETREGLCTPWTRKRKLCKIKCARNTTMTNRCPKRNSRCAVSVSFAETWFSLRILKSMNKSANTSKLRKKSSGSRTSSTPLATSLPRDKKQPTHLSNH